MEEPVINVIEDIHTGIIEIPSINTDIDLINNTLPEIDIAEVEVINEENIPEEIKEINMEEDLEINSESVEEIKEEVEIQEKVEKIENTEKNIAPTSHENGQKKKSDTLVTPKIKSDIAVEELDLPSIVSFDKQYFENKYKDIVSLTTTEVKFYDEQDGFNNQDYAKINTAFFDISSSTNGEWSVANSRPIIKIEQFRR